MEIKKQEIIGFFLSLIFIVIIGLSISIFVHYYCFLPEIWEIVFVFVNSFLLSIIYWKGINDRVFEYIERRH